MNNYDVIVVGASLYGCLFAYQAKQKGLSVLVVDDDNHIGMNLFSTKYKENIVQPFGEYFLKTNDEELVSFIKNFVELKDFNQKIKIQYKKVHVNIPLDLDSLFIIYGTRNVEELKKIISDDIKSANLAQIASLEDLFISKIGPTLYNDLFKNVLKKAFKKDPKEISNDVIDNNIELINYSNYKLFDYNYVLYPINGWTELFDKLLDGIEVKLNISLEEDLRKLKKHCKTLVYSRELEKYFSKDHGKLSYVYFTLKHKVYDSNDILSSYVEFNNDPKAKHFLAVEDNKLFDYKNNNSVVTYFYGGRNISFDSLKFPLITKETKKHLTKYLKDIEDEKNTIFGGMYGLHKIMSIEDEIQSSLKDFEEFINNVN